MPRFAANLGYLFTERPLIERFGAAAAAGFEAVELQFPYDVPAAAVKAELVRHGLAQLGVNTSRGSRDGDFGLAAVPGREREWDGVFKQALDYVVAIGGRAIHCMTGVVPVEQRPAAETVFIKKILRLPLRPRRSTASRFSSSRSIRATASAISSVASSTPRASSKKSAHRMYGSSSTSITSRSSAAI